MSRIFLDTSPFIYYLDGFEPFASKVEKFLLSAMDNDDFLYTSTITDSDLFLTNDKQLKQVSEITVLLVDEL